MIQRGMILIWSGAIGDIPAGFHLCNGGAGTPDLREQFVIGAGDALNPGDTGGSSTHRHSIELDSTSLTPGVVLEDVSPGGDYSDTAIAHDHTGFSELESTFPPYYALAYIMKT